MYNSIISSFILKLYVITDLCVCEAFGKGVGELKLSDYSTDGETKGGLVFRQHCPDLADDHRMTALLVWIAEHGLG